MDRICLAQDGVRWRDVVCMIINLPNQSIYSIVAPIRAAATPDKPAIAGTSNDTAAVLGKRIKNRTT
jgi:hypothetical protein